MSTGKLDIWITEPGDPCRIADATFYVNIAHCNGDILEWCDEKYKDLPAECGHLEVEVPPGCYMIRGARSTLRFGGPGGLYKANWLTDHAVVEVCCGDEECVKLYTPAAKECGWIFLLALQEHGENMGVDENLLNETIDNLEELNEQLPSTASINRRLTNFAQLAETSRQDPNREEGGKGC